MEIPFRNLVDRVRQWPRWMQIAAIGGSVLVGWWVCEDTVWSMASRYSEQAEDLRALLGRGRDQVEGGLRSVQESVVAHGRVLPPRRSAEGSAALAQAANRVIASHQPGVTNYKYDARTGGRMPPSVLRGVVGAGQRVERVLGELEFEATPAIVSKVIADLEASADVDAIASIRLNRIDASKRLRAKLIIEAWVIGSDAGSRSMT